jgi:hypothetical protein
MKEPVKAIHVFAGFLAAAAAPAMLSGVLSMSATFAAMALAVALAVELVVGLPLYLLFRRLGLVSQASVLAAGFVVGASPMIVLIAQMLLSPMRTTGSVGGIPTIVDGVPTLYGWMQDALMLGFFGGLGMIGAAIFWATVGALQKEPAPGEASPRWRRRGALVVIPFAAVIAIFVVPWAMQDRSCHNTFRDQPSGTRSMRPIAVHYVPREWGPVRIAMREFAAANDLDFRTDGDEGDSGYRHFYVSVCNESGVEISAVDARSDHMSSTREGTELSVAVFETRPNSPWRKYSDALQAAFEKRWPGAARRELP